MTCKLPFKASTLQEEALFLGSIYLSQAQAHVQENGSTELEIDVRRQRDALYGNLLKGPSNLSLPLLSGASAGQPEGQQQLTDSIRILREKHVEYQVPAHHDMIKVCCTARELPVIKLSLGLRCLLCLQEYKLPHARATKHSCTS